MSSRFNITAAVLLVSLSGVTHSFAQKTTIEAQVKGSGAKAAEVRIDRQDRKAAAVIARTDARGRFITTNLDPGTYKVSILAAGAPPETQVVTTSAKKPVLLKVDLNQPAGTAAKKKVYVWVPAATGSHMGAHYEEVGTVSGPKGPGASNVENVSAASLQRPGAAVAPAGSR